MGVVYLAEQTAPIRRRVALKLVKVGLDSKEVIARFEVERQALALMSHPGIARVLDAGAASDGRPYFVMEHVAGVSITEYSDRHRLDISERLELFERVCSAVQHAHQKGVVHRDLKPSNILVTVDDGMPTPKIIDFGVAKALHQRLTEKTLYTGLGMLVGTPAYMSPEQAERDELDIDATTDIYSLGVVLHELLTGVLPFDPFRLRSAGYAEMLRILREEDPPRPSTHLSSLGEQARVVAELRRTEVVTLVRKLRGDLDWIVLKATEKDRTHRYASASELAADIRRHLADEPIVARPLSLGHRLRKLARRHRGAAAAAVVVALALILGLASSLLSLIAARAATQDARRQAYRAGLAAAEAAFEEGDVDSARRLLDDLPVDHRGWEWGHLRLKSSHVFALGGDDDSSIIDLAKDANAHVSRLVAEFRDTGDSSYGVRAPNVDGLLFMRPPTAILHELGAAGDRQPIELAGSVLDLSDDGSRTVVTACRAGGVEIEVFVGGLPCDRLGEVSVVDTIERKTLATFVVPAAGVATIHHPGATLVLGMLRPRAMNAVFWDATRGEIAGTLGTRFPEPVAAVLSPTGSLLAAWTWNHVLRVWNVDDGTLVGEFEGHRASIHVAALDEERRTLSSGDWNGEVRVWSLDPPSKVRRFHCGAPALSIATSTRGAVAWGCRNGALGLIASPDTDAARTLGGHESEVLALAFDTGGDRIATGTIDGWVRIWAVKDGKLLARSWVGGGGITALLWESDRAVHAGTMQGGLVRVDLGSLAVRDLLFERSRQVFLRGSSSSDMWSPSGVRLERDGVQSLELRDVDTLALLGVAPLAYQLESGALAFGPTVAVRPGSVQAAVGSGTGIGLIDLRSGRSTASITLEGLRSETLTYTSEGSELIAADREGKLHFWNADDGKHEMETPPGPAPPNLLAVDHTARRVATAAGSVLGVWDRSTSAWADASGDSEIYALAWSPDGDELAVGMEDGRLRTWSLTGRTLRVADELSAHQDGVTAVAYHPDGSRLFTGSISGAATIWARGERAPLARLRGPDAGPVRGAGVRIHTAEEKRGIGVFEFDEALLQAAFSMDGTQIVARRGLANGFRIWRSDLGDVPPETKP